MLRAPRLLTFLLVSLVSWLGTAFFQAPLVAAPPPLPRIAPEAQPILDHFFEVYQKAAAFRVNLRQIRRVDGKTTADASMQVIARKPNEARIQIMAPDAAITLVSDGKQLFVHQSPPNSWVKKDGAVTIPDLTRNMVTGLEALTAADVRASVLEEVDSIRLGESETIGGKPCWRLEFEQPGCEVSCWITQEAKPVLGRLTVRTREQNQKVELETTYSRWSLDPELGPETFVFHPPTDAEEAALAPPGETRGD